MSNDIAIQSLIEKIDDLNQQAWSLRVHDSQKALEQSKEIIGQARSNSYTKGLAQALRTFGFCKMRLSKHEEASIALNEALALFKSSDDLLGQSQVYEILGVLKRVWGDLGGSVELLLKALALNEQTRSTEDEATFNYQLGVTYKHLGDYENALDCFYRSIAITKKMGNTLFESYSTNLIGSVYFETGEYEKALDYYLQALPVRQAAGDKWGEAGSFDNIGFTYLKLKKYQQAEAYCKKSLEITRSTDDRKGQANTLLHLAEVYRESNDLKRAEAHFNESLQIWRAIGDKRGEAEVLLHLAGLYKSFPDQKDHDEFLKSIFGALTIAEEIKSLDILSKSRNSLYEHYKQTGNFREAVKQLELHIILEKELHKNAIDQKVANLEISHKAEVISERNKELTELNERIETANAELKIEASLERVRAVAMGMKEPADMINVCRMISDQLLQLGFEEIRNVQTCIIYPQKHEYLNYQYFTPYDKESIETIDYRLHPDVLEFSNLMLSSPDAYYTKTFEGEELKVWREYRKQTNQLPDPKLDETTSSHYYFYSIGSGALGVTTYAPLSGVQVDLFKRFRNVFELAYRRFIDIEKALAQAREAQIEAALERVRAKSMAMHHSDDLISVINIVQEQLLGLGFHFHAANFVTDYSEKGYTMWLASPGESFPYKIYVPQVGLKYFEAVNAAIEKGSDFATYTLNFEEKNIYFKNLFENSLARNTSEEGKRIVFESKGMAASVVLLDKVRLNLMNLDLIPFTDEENNILRRFGYVFEQSYTRFLDLQRAEAQARESQIQLAMERVRARTMAMQRSEELAEVATVLFQQVKALGVSQWVCGFGIWEIGDKEFTWYPGSPDGVILAPCMVPLTEHPVFISIDESRRRGDELFMYEKKGEFQADHYRYMMSLPCMRESLQNMLDAGLSIPSFQIDHIANFSHGNLIFITYQHVPEMHDIFKRFAKVFEQTYTRFLDLQKAEAQTKEAQTEVALERIRARAMAMHSSNELMDVAHILREQMGLLDQPDLETSVVNLFDEDSDYIHSWHAFREPGASSGKIINGTVSFRKDSSELTREMIGLYTAGKKEYTLEAKGEKLNEFIQVLTNSQPEISNYIGKNPPEKVFYHFATFTGGALLTVSYQPTTEDIKSLQRRAASVFDMAYRRYRDLKKAEAQTREAQIEIAVERVRAKALAMHKSEEILSVVVVLRNELLGLNIPGVSGTTIYLKQDDGRIRMWDLTSVIELEDGFHLSMDIIFPLEETHPELFIRKIWDATEKYSVQIQNRNDLMRTVEWLGEYKKEEAENVKRFIETSDLKNLFHSTVPLANGKLSVDLMEPPPAEMESILQKMATAFDLAYKRFLDLQKAEAQAREAQIEAGLERVRSKTMAMHKSEEVTGVAVSLNEELLKLGFEGGSTIIIINRETGDTEQWTGFSEDKSIKSCYVPYFKHPYHDAMFNAWKSGEIFLVYTLAGDEKRSIDDHYFETGYKIFPENDKKWMRAMDSVTFSHAFMKYGGIHWGPDHLSDEQLRILQRFSKVFEQSYTRFLDLQKAEAQAREAQIEAAMERVRGRSMAMHKSDELREVVAVLFAQLQHLGFDIKFCSIALIDKFNSTVEFWLSGFSQEILPESYHVPNLDHPFYRNFQNVFQRGIPYHVFEIYGEEKKSYDRLWFTLTDFKNLPEPVKKPMMDMERVVLSCAFTKNGMIQIGGFEPLSDIDASIVQRFSKVFEQTHTRFLDLQKAEAQAREAQIEAALERVRAKVMAMTISKDLNETSLVFGEQLRKLGIDWQFSYFWLIDEPKNENVFWITWPDYKTSLTSYTMGEAEEYFNDCLRSWRGGIKIHDNYVPPEGVQGWLDTFQRIADDAGGEAKKIMVPQTFPTGVYYYDAMMKYGSFGICISKPATDEEKKIQCRFAIEFERAYTRFLDLKQAEAQSREAQIELGLERVRARAMAMQNSDELKELIGTVYTELTKLDLILDRCFILIYDNKSMGVTWWMSNPEALLKPIGLFVKYHEQPPYQAFIKGWKERNLKWQYILEGEVKKTWDKFLFVETELSHLPDFVIANMKANEKVYLSASFNNFGCLTLATLESLSDEHFDILLRFAKVFDLTYTRFNDLKQAEAQAREARIETALEKVRASTMAMQRSEDLSQTAFVLFNQFKELGEAPERIFIATFDDHDSGVIDLWGTDQGGNQLNKLFKLPVNEPTMVTKIIAAWKEKKRSVVVDLKGEELKTYLGFLKQAGIPVTEGVMTERRVQTAACFSSGVIGVTTPEPQSAEAVQLQERFAGVFDLTYTRFLDLQKAEEQAHKAQIETALERVRARALAMQEPEELKEVADVLRTEMGLLGVEELETCSIYINDESAEKAECWYALKDIRSEEKKLVNDHFALSTLNDTWVGREMLQFYQSPGKQISIVMQGENRKEWIRYCEDHSAPFRGYYGDVIPDRTYHLYKFSHGAIGAAAAGDISDESWRMLSRAASVFSLAYSRFKDLTQARTDLMKLKEEKKRAEEALTELQATQKQLIQSEKMASLGELTAGIAHEIQNPLNFVNNFSDVSNELLEEMKQELATGNTQQAIEIVKDVKENLEKILHHGKRADAIVKGMLQHSRSSSGQKEPTDINVLAEEYLRLAYHGLRAKDKFFNAKFETDLDPSINKINVVPQEIGRVILNLINNSFYAVSEKKKNTGNGYEPIVTVSTRGVKPPLGGLGVVEITVKDNGNGIPKKVLDKIFQPFFTTKPTGQGTGLGLSLSYDIVTKGHDGEIKVNTKENEGTEFTIILPA